MERLTRKSDTSDMVWFIDREHKSGYAEREPCDMDTHHARLAIAKLAEYEILEEQGKLLKLPVPVGSRVYEPYRFMGEGAWEIDVHTIKLEDLDKIGESVFLTKEEAEAALKESQKSTDCVLQEVFGNPIPYNGDNIGCRD